MYKMGENSREDRCFQNGKLVFFSRPLFCIIEVITGQKRKITGDLSPQLCERVTFLAVSGIYLDPQQKNLQSLLGGESGS